MSKVQKMVEELHSTMSYEAIGKAIGRSGATISNWARGATTPDHTASEKLADLLGRDTVRQAPVLPGRAYRSYAVIEMPNARVTIEGGTVSVDGTLTQEELSYVTDETTRITV